MYLCSHLSQYLKQSRRRGDNAPAFVCAYNNLCHILRTKLHEHETQTTAKMSITPHAGTKLKSWTLQRSELLLPMHRQIKLSPKMYAKIGKRHNLFFQLTRLWSLPFWCTKTRQLYHIHMFKKEFYQNIRRQWHLWPNQPCSKRI